MANVLITGGSGSIGRKLIPVLQRKGHQVSIIGRSQYKIEGVSSFVWDLDKGAIDENVLRDVTHIIHLAGAGIADKPWSPSRKKEILDSRVKPLELLAETLIKRNQRIQAIISSSAVGYYGAVTSDEVFDEEAKPADDFLGVICVNWERAVRQFAEVSDREVRVRTGVVLMTEGGALPKLVTPAKYGLGSAIGSGNQWMPWIHIDDMVSVYVKAVEDSAFLGAYNAVAPEHANQITFVKNIGKAISRPVFLPSVPGFILKTVLGEMSKVVTEGSRVSSEKLRNAGFEFKFPELQPALNDLLK